MYSNFESEMRNAGPRLFRADVVYQDRSSDVGSDLLATSVVMSTDAPRLLHACSVDSVDVSCRVCWAIYDD